MSKKPKYSDAGKGDKSRVIDKKNMLIIGKRFLVKRKRKIKLRRNLRSDRINCYVSFNAYIRDDIISCYDFNG